MSSVGCCLSSARSQSSPYDHDGPRDDESSRAIANTGAQEDIGAGPASAHHRQQGNGQGNGRVGIATQPRRPLGLGEHFNQPLKRHVWTAQRQWTREQLDREREEYFDTRVTGRQETWSAIRMAVEAMTEDLDTAQTILDAAGITIPTGDLVEGAYDEFGNYYTVPEQCLSDPLNIVATLDNTMSSLKIADDEDDEDENLDTDEDEIERRREEKGKKVVHAAEMYTVKARLSDRGGPDVQIGLGKDQSVRVLARKVQEEAGVSTFFLDVVAHGTWLADFEHE
ncbi:hypothetical protein FGG08_000898 [Glutinoglossum americanum]|uniref:DC-UbP/UBTD2 N-terminal domain-containing protein n=1 Tax=Glutinoglossum americanum TaxID=1670608 RepID=A0A9P8IFP9_9PEZI|nr:hypothetical protein FGG08_000898 [Glutinoglossum americanum]